VLVDAQCASLAPRWNDFVLGTGSTREPWAMDSWTHEVKECVW
jgi:hypothetical protein